MQLSPRVGGVEKLGNYDMGSEGPRGICFHASWWLGRLLGRQIWCAKFSMPLVLGY
jgi:hypothetical protein